jgi:hypothetical protein
VREDLKGPPSQILENVVNTKSIKVKPEMVYGFSTMCIEALVSKYCLFI